MSESLIIQRNLSYCEDGGERRLIEQEQLLEHGSPIVILGEPGMGKTVLLQEVAQREQLKFVRAAKFLRDSPHNFSDGSMLVIDALDEVSTVREGDPLHHVLAKLADIGRPPFILSCRSADWNGRLAHNDILEDYFTEAKELTLEPLSENEASEFLANVIGKDPAAAFLYALHEKGMGDLSTNPMTLQMLASIAKDGIPDGRADLYHRAIEKLRIEHNLVHRSSKLSKLSSNQVWDAAGLMSATLLLSGKDSLSKSSGGEPEDNDLPISELGDFEDPEILEAVLGSRLFRSTEEGNYRFVPIHKTVAEYCGARWLVNASKNERMKKRLVALFKHQHRLPASLRGLHTLGFQILLMILRAS